MTMGGWTCWWQMIPRRTISIATSITAPLKMRAMPRDSHLARTDASRHPWGSLSAIISTPAESICLRQRFPTTTKRFTEMTAKEASLTLLMRRGLPVRQLHFYPGELAFLITIMTAGSTFLLPTGTFIRKWTNKIGAQRGQNAPGFPLHLPEKNSKRCPRQRGVAL